MWVISIIWLELWVTTRSHPSVEEQPSHFCLIKEGGCHFIHLCPVYRKKTCPRNVYTSLAQDRKQEETVSLAPSQERTSTFHPLLVCQTDTLNSLCVETGTEKKTWFHQQWLQTASQVLNSWWVWHIQALTGFKLKQTKFQTHYGPTSLSCVNSLWQIWFPVALFCSANSQLRLVLQYSFIFINLTYDRLIWWRTQSNDIHLSQNFFNIYNYYISV